MKTKKDRAKKTEVEAQQPQTDLSERIARRAYELYLERDGQHDHDLDDWLRAEREILGAGRERRGR